MKQSQMKLMFLLLLIFSVLAIGIFAVSSTLLTPSAGFTDDDGILDLRGICIPTPHDGTTSFNVSNATLYTNVFGTWLANKSISATGNPGNTTYHFNFTNSINNSPEGDFQWNIQCNEENTSNMASSNQAFAGNRSISVSYAKPSIVINSPFNNIYSLNGHDIPVVCTAIPSTNFNITRVDLLINKWFN